MSIRVSSHFDGGAIDVVDAAHAAGLKAVVTARGAEPGFLLLGMKAGTFEIAKLTASPPTETLLPLAVIFWFILLPGPSGAVLYRLARFFDEEWSARRGDPEFGDFGDFAHKAYAALDWLPVRLSAAAFSVVGDFEDAVYCWRAQANQWADKASGILLASGGGALGVRLGMPIHESGEVVERPEMGIGDEADADFMQSN